MSKHMECGADIPGTGEGRTEQTVLTRARSWIVTPRGLTVSGIAVIAVGLALNWSWLVAVGAAPLVLSLAPCAAMCALGLCMNMRGQPNPPIQKSDATPFTGPPQGGIEGQASRGP
jgi:hypothetical protein